MNQTLCGRPLTFGDPEQIRTLKVLRRKAEIEEERERRREAGEIAEYRVRLSVEVEVEAVDENEAVELARDIVGQPHYYPYPDIEVDEVRKLDNPPARRSL